MTFEATGPFLLRVMKMMFPAPIFFSQVAAVTKGITMNKYFSAMRFMTVIAYYSFLIHLALKEGCININFLKDLSIGKIQSLIKQGG